MKLFAVMATLLSAAFPAFAQDSGQSLDLNRAIEIALRENPSVHEGDAGLGIARARLSQARATWLPQLQVTATAVESDNPVFVFGSLLEQGRFGAEHFDPLFLNNPDKLTNYRTAVNLRFALFDQLRRVTGNSQARLGVESATAQADYARQQVRAEVIRAYYAVLLAEAARDVADESVRTAESEVSRVRASYEGGLVVRSDLLGAEVQLADFRQRQITARGDIAIARAGLAAALGADSVIEAPLAGGLPDSELQIGDVSTLTQTALERRADWRSARLAEQQSDLAVRAAAGQFLPRLDAFANYGASGDEFTTDGSDSTVGAVVTLNLLDPGRAGRFAEARAQRSMASARRERAEQGVRFEVVQATQRFVSARERLAVAQSAAEQSTEALRIARDRYHAGLTTMTELLRAETASLDARMRLISARGDYVTGYANVLLTTGELTDSSAFSNPLPPASVNEQE